MGAIDVLAFGAHADDIELACGGTLLHVASTGGRTGIVDLTRGEMGTRGSPRVREREARAAQKLLGALVREQLDLTDGGLQTGREEELAVIRVIRTHRPAIVLAPFPDDRHPDHTRAGRLVTEAAFYAGLARIDTGQKAHRPQAVLYYFQNYLPAPSLIVDISAVFKKKMKAIAAYRSQFFDPKSKEPPTMIAKETFLQMIEARARHYGSMIGADFGEPFVSKLPPRIDDLVAAYRGREVS